MKHQNLLKFSAWDYSLSVVIHVLMRSICKWLKFAISHHCRLSQRQISHLYRPLTYAGAPIKEPVYAKPGRLELKIMAGKRVYLNLSRQLQPLESYAIESLNMKGSMRGQNGQILALIQTPMVKLNACSVVGYLG